MEVLELDLCLEPEDKTVCLDFEFKAFKVVKERVPEIPENRPIFDYYVRNWS